MAEPPAPTAHNRPMPSTGFFKSVSESPYRVGSVAFAASIIAAVIGLLMPDSLVGLLLLGVGLFGVLLAPVSMVIIAVGRRYGLEDRAIGVATDSPTGDLGLTFLPSAHIIDLRDRAGAAPTTTTR